MLVIYKTRYACCLYINDSDSYLQYNYSLHLTYAREYAVLNNNRYAVWSFFSFYRILYSYFYFKDMFYNYTLSFPV